MSRALDRESILEILEKELPYLREKYGVVRLALYGSFASGVPRRKSDVDLLVELSRPLGLEFVALYGRWPVRNCRRLRPKSTHC